MSRPPLVLTAPVARPRRRRARWEAELLRLDTLWRERRVRDLQDQANRIALQQGQLEDLRHRLADLERAVGLADIGRAPIGRGELRRFAGWRG